MPHIVVERDTDQTGDKERTPRSEIIPVFAQDLLIEVDLLGDSSESEKWGRRDGRKFPVWPVQLQAMKSLTAVIADLDSQKAREQAGGSDEDGGTFTAMFSDVAILVGDLNKTNFDRKMAALRHPADGHPLPHGGTRVIPACQLLDEHYLEEFAKDEDTGLWVPVANRPHRARGLLSDGAMTDRHEMGQRLALESHLRWLDELEQRYQGLWPGEEWFCGILGDDNDDQKAAVAEYMDIAERHPNVHVYNFVGVENGDEIADDLAYAMLNRK